MIYTSDKWCCLDEIERVMAISDSCSMQLALCIMQVDAGLTREHDRQDISSQIKVLVPTCFPAIVRLV